MELQGTNVAAGIVPFTDQDGYATHQAKYGQGGLRTATNRAERLALPKDRRELYMEVTDADTGIKWRLNSGLDSEVTTDADWDTVPGSGDMQRAEYAPSRVPGVVDYALEIATETQDRIIYVSNSKGNDEYDGSSWDTSFKTLPKALTSIKRNCPSQISVLLDDGIYDCSSLTQLLFFNFGSRGGINVLGKCDIYKYVALAGGWNMSDAEYFHRITVNETNSDGSGSRAVSFEKDFLSFKYSVNSSNLATNNNYTAPRANGVYCGTRIAHNSGGAAITMAEGVAGNATKRINEIKSKITNLNLSLIQSAQEIDVTDIWFISSFVRGFALIDLDFEFNGANQIGLPFSLTAAVFNLKHTSFFNVHITQSTERPVAMFLENGVIQGSTYFCDSYKSGVALLYLNEPTNSRVKICSLWAEGNFGIGIYASGSPSSLHSPTASRNFLNYQCLALVQTGTPYTEGGTASKGSIAFYYLEQIVGDYASCFKNFTYLANVKDPVFGKPRFYFKDLSLRNVGVDTGALLIFAGTAPAVQDSHPSTNISIDLFIGRLCSDYYPSTGLVMYKGGTYKDFIWENITTTFYNKTFCNVTAGATQERIPSLSNQRYPSVTIPANGNFILPLINPFFHSLVEGLVLVRKANETAISIYKFMLLLDWQTQTAFSKYIDFYKVSGQDLALSVSDNIPLAAEDVKQNNFYNLEFKSLEAQALVLQIDTKFISANR